MPKGYCGPQTKALTSLDCHACSSKLPPINPHRKTPLYPLKPDLLHTISSVAIKPQWQEILRQAKQTIISPTSSAHLHMWRNASDASATDVGDSRLAQEKKRPQLSNTFITAGFKRPWRLFAWSHQGPKVLHKLLCLVKGRLRKTPSAAAGLSIR